MPEIGVACIAAIIYDCALGLGPEDDAPEESSVLDHRKCGDSLWWVASVKSTILDYLVSIALPAPAGPMTASHVRDR